MDLDFIFRHLPKPWSRAELRAAINDALAKDCDRLKSADEKKRNGPGQTPAAGLN
jgi:hypothetical protein